MPKTPEWYTVKLNNLNNAFEVDGYEYQSHLVEHPLIDNNVSSSMGVVGMRKSDGRKIFYLKGDSYQMGWLFGALSEQDASLMCTTYIKHTALGFISPRFDEMLMNQPAKDWLMSKLLDIYEYILVRESVSIYNNNKQHIPEYLRLEMKGIADGCKYANSSTEVTFDRVVALNYSFDVLSSYVYSGEIFKILKKAIAKAPQHLQDELFKKFKKAIHIPNACDGFYVKGSYTVGRKPYFCRDYQLGNARVWEKTNCTVIYDPFDNSSEQVCLASITAPGFVGSFTAFNEHGFCSSMDMIRSSNVDIKNLGLGGVLMVRHLASVCTSVSEATLKMNLSQRGGVMIFSVADSYGKAVSFESGKTEPSQPSYLKGVVDERGAWTRSLDFGNTSSELAKFYLKFNEESYKKLGLINIPSQLVQSYPDYFGNSIVATQENSTVVNGAKLFNPDRFLNTSQMVYPSFEVENVLQEYIQNNYFCPLKQVSTDYIVFGNQAFVPQAREHQMTKYPNLMAGTADAIMWRYENLNHLINFNKGQIDLDVAKSIITNLSPWKQPDYTLNSFQYGVYPEGYKTPHSEILSKATPGKLQISGAISVCDINERVMYTKSGYWGSEWITCTLLKYLI